MRVLCYHQKHYLFVYHSSQGLGVPTGPHGAFRDYQVDAITLEISPKVSPDKMISRSRNEFILRGGRYVLLIQVLVINNLRTTGGPLIETCRSFTIDNFDTTSSIIFTLYPYNKTYCWI